MSSDSTNVRPLVTNRQHFRCPVCGRVEPRYNSLVICCLGRDRTICFPCVELIVNAHNLLKEDDKGDGNA